MYYNIGVKVPMHKFLKISFVLNQLLGFWDSGAGRLKLETENMCNEQTNLLNLLKEPFHNLLTDSKPDGSGC